MFKRIANLFRGFLGLFISGLERQNPEALLENEKENLADQALADFAAKEGMALDSAPPSELPGRTMGPQST